MLGHGATVLEQRVSREVVLREKYSVEYADSCIPRAGQRIHGALENVLGSKLQGMAAALSPFKEKFVIHEDDRWLARDARVLNDSMGTRAALDEGGRRGICYQV